MALNAGSLKCVVLLLKAGADVKGVGTFGHLPIELAAYNNRRKDVEILLPDDPMYKMSPADMKLAASEAYRRQDYITAMKLYTRDFEKACDAFFDGLKLDPASDEIAEALRSSRTQTMH
uniref:Uncharacterized protein n=1 Tax=Oryza nivara TaxID=4536 RepID=A0A0E0G6S9_ORYNI